MRYFRFCDVIFYFVKYHCHYKKPHLQISFALPLQHLFWKKELKETADFLKQCATDTANKNSFGDIVYEDIAVRH